MTACPIDPDCLIPEHQEPVPTPDLSPAEAAIVARFDAAEPAPESYWPVVAGPGPCDRSPAEQDDELVELVADAIAESDDCSRAQWPGMYEDRARAAIAALAARPSADQQDGERERIADEVAGRYFNRGDDELPLLRADVYAALSGDLAARPSADTETRRRVRELATALYAEPGGQRVADQILRALDGDR